MPILAWPTLSEPKQCMGDMPLARANDCEQPLRSVRHVAGWVHEGFGPLVDPQAWGWRFRQGVYWLERHGPLFPLIPENGGLEMRLL